VKYYLVFLLFISLILSGSVSVGSEKAMQSTCEPLGIHWQKTESYRPYSVAKGFGDQETVVGPLPNEWSYSSGTYEEIFLTSKTDITFNRLEILVINRKSRVTIPAKYQVQEEKLVLEQSFEALLKKCGNCQFMVFRVISGKDLVCQHAMEIMDAL
jgi:hypothetical protein